MKIENTSTDNSSSKKNYEKNLYDASKVPADKIKLVIKPKTDVVTQEPALSKDDDISRQIALENLKIAQESAAGTVTTLANKRAIEEMKVAFKPKTKLQRSAM